MPALNSNLHGSRQRGAALIVALIMLLVMTVLGIAAMGVTRMEERMAGNMRDIDVAFQAAEAGLREGEERIRARGQAYLFDVCSTPPCNFWQYDYWVAELRNQPVGWWQANGVEFGVAGSRELMESTRDPYILMQDMRQIEDSPGDGDSPETGRQYYKVTSNGAGSSDTANVIVESTFVRRYSELDGS